MGGAKLRREISRSLDYSGGVFLFLAKKDGQPIAPGTWPEHIWPIRDDLVEPVRDGANPVPTGWKTRNGTQEIVYPDHAVAHIFWPDPADPFRGIGPMQAAWRSADHLFRLEAFDDGLVENGGQIGGVFTHDNKAMDPQDRKALEDRIAQNHSRPQQDRKKIVLPAGISFTPTAWSPVDMQGEKLRREKRDEIARTFGVPPPMLGQLEDANRSSLRELRRVYYENTVIPRADFVVEEIATQLIPKLPAEASRVVVLMDYGSTAAMREDADAQIARMEKLVALGVPTTEAARIAGIAIEGVPDGERWVSGTLRRIDEEGLELGGQNQADPLEDEPADQEEPNAEDPDEPEKAVHRSDDARRRSIAEAEEKRLRRADNRIAAGARKVFRELIDAQIAKLHDIAAQSGEARNVGEWDLLPTFAHWTRSTQAYAEQLDLVPPIGRAAIVTVKGATEDELARLLVEAEKQWGEALWDAIKGAIAGAIEDAAKAAQRAVGGELVKLGNPIVARYMQAKQVQIVEGPMSVVAARVKRILASALAEGSTTAVSLADRVREGLEGMVNSLQALQDQLGTRAMMIARTESAGASNTARVEQFKAAGVVQHEWITAGDDLVRDGHEIDGEVAVLGESFSNGMRKPHDPSAPAALVINCLPGDQLVSGAVVAASKAWYSGPMVEVEAEDGHRLTVTINHPVLTTRGFVRAGALREGDNVICEPLDIHRRPARWDVQDQNGPPTIEKVFESIAAHGSSRSATPSRGDLYGDGRFFKGQIEVVSLPSRSARIDDAAHLDLELRGKPQPALTQGKDQLNLVLPDLAGRVLASAGIGTTRSAPGGFELAPNSVGVRSKSAPLQSLGVASVARRNSVFAHDPMDHDAADAVGLCQPKDAGSRLKLSNDSILVDGRAHQLLRLGATAELHTTILGPSGDGGPLHADLAADLLRGFAGRIAARRVVSLRVRHFEGFVYDLHTAQGYFAAGDQATAIVRNCRCLTAPVLPT